MASFTDKSREPFASIPIGPCEWPEVVVRDSIVSPELGTQANSILIGDGLAPLGSASNPIVIHIDEDRCYDNIGRCDSDADNEFMATPEFWDALIDESFSTPADERGAVGSSLVGATTRSPAHEDLETLHSFGQSSTNGFHLDDKALETIERSFTGLQNCPGLESIRRENVANSQANREPSTERGKVYQAEELNEVHETSSIATDASTQETTGQTGTPDGKGLPCGLHDAGSAKRKLSHAEGVSSELRRSERLAKRARP